MKEMKLWYPYAQMKTKSENYHVVSAKGTKIKIRNPHITGAEATNGVSGGSSQDNSGAELELIDGVASWWCACHGYSNPELNGAITDQMEKFSHVMLGGLTHDPAKKLASLLVDITPASMNHVFFSDSGSVGVEVAIKMAIQYFSNKGRHSKNKIVGLKNAYHGDTFKAMEVGDDPDFHGAYSHLFNGAYHIDQPTNGYDLPEDVVLADVAKLETLLADKHEEIAAFIVEPLIQAAGGFNFYSPKYLEHARRICDKYDVLFIFDEVATGFGRTGKLFAVDHTNVEPDIMILGKAMTGGYLGHAATITNSKVFDAFYSDDPDHAFMHGPTYMGNPITCAVALKSFEIFKRDNYLERVETIEAHLKKRLSAAFEKTNVTDRFKDVVRDVRVLGVTAVIEVTDYKYTKDFQKFAIEKGVWLRSFGNYIYTMPPYIISTEELDKIIDVMIEWVS